MLRDKKTRCMFCSLGCGLVISSEGKRPVELRHSGPLCPRGNYMLELLKSPSRLNTCRIKHNRMLLASDHDRTLSFLADKLLSVKKSHGASSIGVVLSADRTSEELVLAYNAFKGALGTSNIDVALPLEDIGSLKGNDRAASFKLKDLSVDDLDDADALLIVGDVLTRSAVLSRKINHIKYKSRSSRIIVVDPEKSHTSWFATNHLRPVPGTEALLLAGMIHAASLGKGRASRFRKYFSKIDLKEVSKRTGVLESEISSAAGGLASAKRAAAIIVSGFGGDLVMELSKVLAACSGQRSGVIPFYSAGNSEGAFRIMTGLRGGKGLSFSEMIQAALKNKLKALVLFGVDPLRHAPVAEIADALSNLQLLAVADVYRSPVMDYADVVLPLASHLEVGGSALFSGGREATFDAVVPPAGSLSVSEISSKIHSAIKPKGKIACDPKKALRLKRKRGKLLLNRLYGELAELKPVKEDKKYPFLLYLKDDIAHSGDGSVTRMHFWASRECPAPYAEVSEEDGEKLGLSSGDRILLRTPKGELVITVKVSAAALPGTIGLPHHFQEVRELAGIEFDDDLRSFRAQRQRGAVEKIG